MIVDLLPVLEGALNALKQAEEIDDPQMRAASIMCARSCIETAMLAIRTEQRLARVTTLEGAPTGGPEREPDDVEAHRRPPPRGRA